MPHLNNEMLDELIDYCNQAELKIPLSESETDESLDILWDIDLSDGQIIIPLGDTAPLSDQETDEALDILWDIE